MKIEKIKYKKIIDVNYNINEEYNKFSVYVFKKLLSLQNTFNISTLAGNPPSKYNTVKYNTVKFRRYTDFNFLYCDKINHKFKLTFNNKMLYINHNNKKGEIL